jgi:hypothetical protein
MTRLTDRIIKQLSHIYAQNKFCGYREKRTQVRWEHPKYQRKGNDKHLKLRYTDVMPVTNATTRYKGVAANTSATTRYKGVAANTSATTRYKGVAANTSATTRYKGMAIDKAK